MKVSEMPVAIVVFGMKGCNACTAYLPVFRKIAEKHDTIPAFAIDCSEEKNGPAADHYKVTVTPTTVLMKHGRPVMRFEGEGNVKDIEKLFRYAEGR